MTEIDNDRMRQLLAGLPPKSRPSVALAFALHIVLGTAVSRAQGEADAERADCIENLLAGLGFTIVESADA